MLPDPSWTRRHASGPGTQGGQELEPGLADCAPAVPGSAEALAAPKAEGWARDRSGQRREQRTGERRLIPSREPCLGARLSDPCGARLLWVVLNLALSPIPSCQDCRFNQDAGADKYLDWAMESSTEPPALVCLGEAGSGGIELFVQPPCLN